MTSLSGHWRHDRQSQQHSREQFLTAFLRYLHTVKFIHLKCTRQCFLFIQRVVQSLPLFNSRTFFLPKKATPHPLLVTPHSHPFSRPWQLLIYLLSLRIPLFWKFHINGGITHELFLNGKRKQFFHLYSSYCDLIGWISVFRKVLPSSAQYIYLYILIIYIMNSLGEIS